ncbi:MAG: immunoglobulin domain-containing protein [Opitutaceae bacterium]|nr:immunoglobulin domain-containing protein [Opitutaceae bacterium]
MGPDAVAAPPAGFVNGPGTAARFNNPVGLAIDKNGVVYVADQSNHAIRRIIGTTVTTLAGGGPANLGSSDGTGTAARFNLPSGVAVDANLNVYVGDYGNHTIRKITPEGVVTTFAGQAGAAGSADGNGTTARFNGPYGLAVDGSGNIYVCEFSGHTIRRISPNGDVTTLAGLAGTAGAANGSGSTARFNQPANIAVDSEGNLFVSDLGNHTIRRSHFPPRFATQPVSQSLFPGGTATFVASVASSLPPLDLQWRKDGVAIAGATTGTLTVANVQSANTGTYTLVATSPVGSVTSTPATLSLNSAPTFNTHPASQTAALGSTVTFTAVATGAGTLTYQWLKDGAALAGATNATLTITNVQAASLGTYLLVASNTSGPTVSNPATLSLTPPPTFTLQPASQSVAPGASATFTAAATGVGPITYQWLRDGGPIAGATAPSLVVASVQAGNTGTYTVIASNAGGPAVSNAATLSLLAPPVITIQPASQSVAAGDSVTFTTGANGPGVITFQWRKDGLPLSGATTTSLVLENVQAANLGSYSVVATNSVGSTASNAAVLSFNASNAGRLVNLAIRSQAGSGPQTLIVGLVVGGAGVTGTKPLLVRGIGPTLGLFGVSGVLADPTLSVFSGSTVIASNDNWGGDAQISSVGSQVGAFALGVSVSRDAALYNAGLQPGPYTVQVSGVGGASGVALAEIYDATAPSAFLATTPRLINVSARTQVGSGAEILIAGFAIGGTTAKSLLIRAIGPTLASFGVAGALADPKLDLFSGPTLLQSNDNWGGGALIASAAASVGAFSLDATSRDAVLLVSLQPGSYTAQVSGVNNTTGVALVEIYEVP